MVSALLVPHGHLAPHLGVIPARPGPADPVRIPLSTHVVDCYADAK